MAKVISVILPKTSLANGQVSDAHACAMAYPHAVHAGAVAIEVEHEGGFTARYTIAEIRALLAQQPNLHALGGIGHPEPQRGMVQVGGQYIYTDQLLQLSSRRAR